MRDGVPGGWAVEKRDMGVGMVTVLALLAVLSASGNAAGAEGDWTELVAAVPRDFPPYYTIDGAGLPQGHSIEVMEEVARKARIRVRYEVRADWESAMEALRRGEADLIPSLGITPERMVDFDFTTPVETFALGIFARSDDQRVYDMGGIAGVKTGLVKGNAAVAWIRDYPQVRPQEFHSQEQALFALLAGEIDTLIYPVTVTWRLASELGVEGRIRQAGMPLVEIKRAVAVRRGNNALLERLDQAVREYTRSEQFGAAYARLHAPPKPFWDSERTIRYILGAMVVMLGFLVVTLVWSYRRRLADVNRQLAQCRAFLRDGEQE